MTGTAEIAVREGVVITPAERAAAAAAASDLDSWLIVMKDVVLLSEHIAHTSFVPRAYRGDPPAVAAAILAGRELGLPPMTALRHVQVVEGSPGLSAEYKRARVLAAGHKLDIDEHTTEACQVTGHRQGHKSVTVKFTIADARRAGLVKDRGAYMTRPRRMLFARACTEVVDALFSDLTNGLPTTELLEEEAEQDAVYGAEPREAAPERQRVTPDQIRQRRAALPAVAAPENVPPAPPHVPPTAAPATPEPGAGGTSAGGGERPPALASTGQRSQIRNHFKRLAIDPDSEGGWDTVLVACARLAGLAAIADLAELTESEAADVLGQLRPLKDGEAGAKALTDLINDGVMPGE